MYLEDLDKSPAFPGRFICLVLIVSFCFVGDNIFRPGVRSDHHLHPRQQNLFTQNRKIFPSKVGKSSERGNLRNPAARAELQIRWKKILANPEPQSARLSSASSDWNHIS